MRFAALRAVLAPYNGVIFTTHSHTREAPRCRVLLELDMPVVTDGICFSSRAELEEVVALGYAAGAPVQVLDCRVPVPVAQERVEFDRSNDPTVPADRDAALVAAVQERFDALPDWATLIDGTAGVERVREAVTRALAVETPRS